ncbi:hypothetical protein SARC_10560 [Sphaeroforma arctica JP610]|uniref:DNA replication complex GINS protein PSF2 n=1 Tax=Sphaeroforma arctica JP610 TaxID=667725 RepID=A0A0L0FJK1_9EUKA|nr:hypothetical protein SARC_10560 [Sphaeroforma arctica JP610]KNC76964.1 hypothetical protein SARC_10560 [Sphaeroforma arctica JP610]|eukprot:XP_014150866.1 hypothetical protein SARC_10560 [Sphaeroforma arctica JP610]
MDPSRHTAAEVNFVAENAILDIIPSFKLEGLHLITKSYGPFQPQRTTQVPLWLALELKSSKRCQIVCPSWMTVENLKLASQRELENETSWEKMHPAYLEVSMALLCNAADDIQSPSEVRLLLNTIWDARFAKIKKQLHHLEADSIMVRLTNLTMMEINRTRQFVTEAMFEFQELDDCDNQER